MDLRWASDGSVYLALLGDGAVEVSLASLNAPPKEMIPPRSKPGGLWLSNHVAATSTHLIVSPPAFSFTWRRLDDPARVEEPFSHLVDIDAHGDRLIVLGARKDEKTGVFSPDGAIGWIGSLSKSLKDLRPFLYAGEGPGARYMAACAPAEVGAVRFLDDGSFLVAPGSQPGIFLYSPEARLVRSWDTASLGIDTDCASRRAEVDARSADDPQSRAAWLNRRRIVDDIALLPSGPAIIVRSVEQGKPRWDLKLLAIQQGGFSSAPLPLRSASPFARLHADTRSRKILFLLSDRPPPEVQRLSPRLITAK